MSTPSLPHFGSVSWTPGARHPVYSRVHGFKTFYARPVQALCITGISNVVTATGNQRRPAAVSVLLDTGSEEALSELYIGLAYRNNPSVILDQSSNAKKWTGVSVSGWQVWTGSAFAPVTATLEADRWRWAGNAGVYAPGLMVARVVGSSARYWRLTAEDSAGVSPQVDVQWFAGGIPAMAAPFYYPRPNRTAIAQNPSLVP